MTTLPALPFELQEEIFQIAAWKCTATANNLLRVSKWVAHRIEPILYEIVTYEGKELTVQKLSPPFIETRPSEILTLFEKHGCHIRYLWLNPICSDSIDNDQATITSILKFCPSLKDISFPSSWTKEMVETVQDHLPHLERLSGSFSGYHTSFDASKPAYQHLTHFDIIGYYGWDVLSPFLTRLPNLTHLAIDCGHRNIIVASNALEECKKLQAVLMVMESAGGDEPRVDESASVGEGEDKRIVHMVVLPFRSWLKGLTGGKDMWKIADEVISERQNAV